MCVGCVHGEKQTRRVCEWEMSWQMLSVIVLRVCVEKDSKHETQTLSAD